HEDRADALTAPLRVGGVKRANPAFEDTFAAGIDAQPALQSTGLFVDRKISRYACPNAAFLHAQEAEAAMMHAFGPGQRVDHAISLEKGEAESADRVDAGACQFRNRRMSHARREGTEESDGSTCTAASSSSGMIGSDQSRCLPAKISSGKGAPCRNTPRTQRKLLGSVVSIPSTARKNWIRSDGRKSSRMMFVSISA